MKRISEEEIKNLFAEWGLWSLVKDISDDGDGQGDNLQLTREGKEAHRMIKELIDGAYFKGKEYQAKLDRECYGMSFEKLDNLNKKENEKDNKQV